MREFPRYRIRVAMKPVHGQAERDAFNARRMALIPPILPERILRCGSVQKMGEFIDVTSPQISTQQLP
jgi:hypothetical protein